MTQGKVYQSGKETEKKRVPEGEDLVQFSIRLPASLLNQVESRMKASKRSRNKEIQFLIERQLDAEVARDKEIMRQFSATSQSNQS